MDIATEITRLQVAKSDLKTAIESKGIVVPAATTIDGYPALVSAIPKKYEYVRRLYSGSFNLKDDTSFDSWTASTTAGSILATASLSDAKFTADMENYEYLLWWKIRIAVAHASGATLKAMPIWEGADSVQSVFRRPNSIATLTSKDKAGNACATQSTAPLLTYYNTDGAVKYTFSNSYGLYGTVQAATFSDSTALTTTVTPKRPILYARCSSSYFATGRKAQVDSANSTFYLTCDLYKMPITQYGQTKLYEGLADTYNLT